MMDSTAFVSSAARPREVMVLRFPGRRYHATPWGHHVNEGQLEWPPSPWRLMRALLSTGYAKLGWDACGPSEPGRSLIEKLAAVLPSYRLPRAVGTHSRHYMPLGRLANGRELTTLVLDTWAQIDDDWLGIHWDVDLSPREREVFGELASMLGYVGRSESWVEASLEERALDEFDVRPSDGRERPGPGWEQVTVLAPVEPVEFARWRGQQLESDLRALPTSDAKGKPLSPKAREKQRQKVSDMYPVDLIRCLQVDTGVLHELGWSQPPGSRKALYWRRSDSLESMGARALPRPVWAMPVEHVLLALSTQSGNMHALPSIVRALPQGELLHRALLSKSGRDGGTVPPVFSGRDENGAPLRNDTGHRHCHLLHLDLDGDNHLDHALVWAPMGLDAEAQKAIRETRRTYTKGGTSALRVALAAAGARSEMMSLPEPWGARLRRVLGGEVAGAVRWRSLTPFVPPRHLKRQGKNSLEGQLASELEARGLPPPKTARLLEAHHDNDLIGRSRHFIRRRSSSSLQPPVDCGYMVELEFSVPITGPIALGYASHFGLGLFEACD